MAVAADTTTNIVAPTNRNFDQTDSSNNDNKDSSAISQTNGQEAITSTLCNAPPSTTSFRHDVCEEKTTQLYCQDQLRLRAKFHLAEWQRTVASKKDHEIFLKMLVVEAHRQNSGHINSHRRNVLIAAIDSAFHSKSNSADPYLSTLQLISSGRLFEQQQQQSPTQQSVADSAAYENSTTDEGVNEYSML